MSAGGDELGEITVSVTAEGTEDAAQEAAEASAGGGGGGGAGGGGGMGAVPMEPPDISGLMPRDEGGGQDQDSGGGDGGGAGIASALGEVVSALGPLAVIAGLLLSLEPIQAALSTVLGIVEGLLAPFLLLGLRLLSPVLRLLVEAIPLLMSFLDDPAGALLGLGEFIVGAITDLPGLIWDFMTDLPGLIATAFMTAVSWFTDLPGALAEALKFAAAKVGDVVSELADAIKDALPGEDSETPAGGGLPTGAPIIDFSALPSLATGGIVKQPTVAQVGEEGSEAVIPLDRLEQVLDNQRGGTQQITFTGGLSAFVERAETSSTVDPF